MSEAQLRNNTNKLSIHHPFQKVYGFNHLINLSKSNSRVGGATTVYTVPQIIFCQLNLLTEGLIDLLTQFSKSPHLKCSKRTPPVDE